MRPVAALTEEAFHREININLLGPLLVIRESLKHFGPNGGSIINIGSGASRSHPPGYAIYSASKAGLDAVTGLLANELVPRRIRVNSVNPGATLSEGTKAAGLYGVGSDIEAQLVETTVLQFFDRCSPRCSVTSNRTIPSLAAALLSQLQLPAGIVHGAVSQGLRN